MKHLDVWIDDDSRGGNALVGRLIRSTGRTGDAISFEYDPTWLNGSGPVSGFQLDPELILATGHHHARAGADCLTGIFADCSPDRWGKKLMKRREAIEAREANRPVRNLRDWDFLIGVNDESRMGALRLMDSDSARYVDDRELSAPPITALRELEAIAAHVERGDTDDTPELVRWLKQLIAPGASLGGARPKASFRDQDGTLWLAKFPSNDDDRDVGLWEYLTHQLAIDAGIEMPEARPLRLSDRGHTFAARRFDRTPTSRRMFASAMTLLDVSESDGMGYLDLVGIIESVGTSANIQTDLEQLFRRALFNILVGNRDDHLRNHGFLREGNGWRLSPAFDINPNPDKASHVLAIDESDTAPDSGNLLAVADYYRLNKRAISRVESQVRTAIREWEAKARRLGLRAVEIDGMRAVIDFER